MSESVEMAIVEDSYKPDSCAMKGTDLTSCVLDAKDETTRSVGVQHEKVPDAACGYAAAQDPCSNKQTKLENVSVDVDVERQNAGRISSRAHTISLLFGSFIIFLMFGMLVFIVLRLLKQV